MQTVEEMCIVNPEVVPGDALGHFVPGVYFICFSLLLYWVLLSRYFKSVAPGSSYQFDGRIPNLTFPFLPCMSVEGFILLVAGPLFFTMNTIHHTIYAYHGNVIEAAFSVITDVHAFAFYSLVPYCAATLLRNKKSFQVPENCPQLLLFFSYGLFGCAYYGHLFTICEYQVELHRFFLITPILLGTACAFGQLWNPSSFLLATAMVFWTYAVGAGFLAIAFIGYYYSDISPHWKHMPTHDKVKHIPPYFAVHCVLMVTFFMLLFILFGRIRGRRLGRNNPEYKWSRALNSNEDEYTPLKISDKEKGLYASNQN